MRQDTIWSRVWQGLTGHVDGWLFFFISVLFLISSFVLYSASGGHFGKLNNKFIYTALGLFLMWLVASVPTKITMVTAVPLYFLSLLMLVAVHFVGIKVNGSTRWLNIGIQIQPSEIMRLAMPMTLAWFFYHFEKEMRSWHYFVSALIMAIPAILILKQPDLGTTIMVVWPAMIVIFSAGLSWRVIAILLVLGTVFVGVIGVEAYRYMGENSVKPIFLKEYQIKRITTALNPEADPLGSGYHVLQAKTAIGSGGLLGTGWMLGSQTHGEFIPEQTTDFILAVYSEEFGFFGNFVLLMIYLGIVIRGLLIALRCKDLYSRLMAAALSMSFLIYFFVNMGM
ncbi:MAG: rod shape-determining protein RodA, partial [Neisseriaceae bacterium]|nr:rod shape-determining protein RodA [Neisseriaceae bacterium]